MANAQGFDALNNRLDALERADPHWLEDAIALLYEALAATPDPLLQDYETFTEAMLAEGLDARALTVSNGKARVEGDNAAALLLDAARLLRALERSANEFSRHMESDRGADLEDAWRTADGRHYVIPRMTALRAVDGKPFLRRALLHYRVLPAALDGFDVRLHRLPSVASAAARAEAPMKASVNYGAALFPGLAVSLKMEGKGGFLVEGLSGFEAGEMLAAHIGEARAQACVAVIWAELTMPDASLAALQELMAATALDGHPSLRFLVAGSWHRKVGDEMRNVGWILDGQGEELFEVMKWAKFALKDRREAIVAGEEVHILVGEDELTVFAICRDFLQETREVPYKRLNVDVAIVPAMLSDIEDLDTMHGHAATAQSMRVRFGTRVLVVGQPAVPDARAVGRVMDFPAKPLASRGRMVKEAWLTCVLDSS